MVGEQKPPILRVRALLEETESGKEKGPKSGQNNPVRETRSDLGVKTGLQLLERHSIFLSVCFSGLLIKI